MGAKNLIVASSATMNQLSTAETTTSKEIEAIQKAIIAAGFSSEMIQVLGAPQGELIADGFSWGLPAVNVAVTGHPYIGLPFGRIAECIGEESSGKTTLCLTAIAHAQKRGFSCGFVDAEHAIDPRYAQALGVDIPNLLFAQPDYGEQGLEAVMAMIRAGVRLVGVDSVAALTPKAVIEGTLEKTQPGTLARIMTDAMGKLSKLANQHQASVIFLNHIKLKIGIVFGDPRTTPGGKALKFYASVRLEQKISGAKKDGVYVDATEGAGDKVRVASPGEIKIIKNKVGPPHRVADIMLRYGKGYDTELSAFDACVSLGLGSFANGYYKIGKYRISAKSITSDFGIAVKALDDYVLSKKEGSPKKVVLQKEEPTVKSKKRITKKKK